MSLVRGFRGALNLWAACPLTSSNHHGKRHTPTCFNKRRSWYNKRQIIMGHRYTVLANTALISSVIYKLVLYQAVFSVLEKKICNLTLFLQSRRSQAIFRRPTCWETLWVCGQPPAQVRKGASRSARNVVFVFTCHLYVVDVESRENWSSVVKVFRTVSRKCSHTEKIVDFNRSVLLSDFRFGSSRWSRLQQHLARTGTAGHFFSHVAGGYFPLFCADSLSGSSCSR